MKHEAVRGRLGTGGVQRKKDPWAWAGVSTRRQALYRQVGEFGAGVGGSGSQAAGSCRVQKQRA